MTRRLVEFIGVAAVFAALVGLLNLAAAAGAGPAAIGGVEVSAAAGGGQPAERGPRTSWGDPDLQGIWNDPYQIPLQRPEQFADIEVFTDEQRTALDEQRGAMLRRDERAPIGTERDVRGAYNAVFESIRPTGDRTSLIVDPPNGRIPPYTPEAEARLRTEREFALALLQPTETCRQQEPACAGWSYGPPSPLREEVPPFYNTGRLNRNDGPEDRSLTERCMGAGLPNFGGFRRIVQSPDALAIFYDVGQGQGRQRVIPIDGRDHLPSHVRTTFGDSRGHWEGDTLVVDVTNFSRKRSYRGSRENLHLVERWRRLDETTLEYVVTIDDPTTWTRPWTVRQELELQDGRANRIYYEPRCHEGNYGLPGQLLGSRVEERAFAEGRGPDPATRDTATGGGTIDDPLGR